MFASFGTNPCFHICDVSECKTMIYYVKVSNAGTCVCVFPYTSRINLKHSVIYCLINNASL